MQHNSAINLIRTSKPALCLPGNGSTKLRPTGQAVQQLHYAGRKAHAAEGNDNRLPADPCCTSEHTPHTSTEANKIQKNTRNADQGQKMKALLTFTSYIKM